MYNNNLNRQKIKKIQNINENQYNEGNNFPLTKKLNSQMLSDKFTKNNMLVAIRARPLSKTELEDSNYNTISVPDKDKIIVTVPTEYIPDDMSGIYLAGEQIKITKIKEVSYNYDFVFDENTTQDEVYRCTTSNLIKQVVGGFSATIMAYGATGSGKTYTMVGKGQNCGLMIRSIRDLFKVINSDKERMYSIKIQYVEVYNEILKDLLTDNNKAPPELRTDPNKGVVLQGVEDKIVLNEEEAFKYITLGNKRRTEKQTDRNKFSSRSHAVLQIYLEIQDSNSNLNNNNMNKNNFNNLNFNNETSFGKFILVDLAGSEKTSSNIKSNSETGSINRSLLALGKCINLIVTQNKKFIPFRESKLTRILQEPLSGNGRIVMIATVSPSILNFDETMFTLQFANRARDMKIHMKKNILEADKQLIQKYADYIQNLKEQINEVERDIIEQQNMSISNISINENDQNNNSIPNSANHTKYVYNEEYEQMKKDIVDHFQEEINLKKKIFEDENKLEELKDDLNDLECQIIRNTKENMGNITDEYESKKKEIDELQEIINKKYLKEKELNIKRKGFLETISELSVKNSGNEQIKNLSNIYKYYTNFIENLSNEHTKNLNINEIKRKEKRISLLNEQLDLRDSFINNANKELKKNNVKFEFNDPNLATKDEIEMEPINPENIKNINIKASPSYKSFNEITKKRNMNTINQSKSDIDNNKNNQNSIVNDTDTINLSQLQNKNRNDRFNDINKFRKKVNNINQNYNKNNLNNYRSNSSYNNKGSTLKNAGENAIQNNYVKRVRNIPSRQNYFVENSEINNDQPLLQNLMLQKKDNSNNNYQNYKYNAYNNYSFYNKKNKVPETNTSRLENEVQKKVKTLLKKDFIGRYKRSPYLHLLNE